MSTNGPVNQQNLGHIIEALRVSIVQTEKNLIERMDKADKAFLTFGEKVNLELSSIKDVIQALDKHMVLAQERHTQNIESKKEFEKDLTDLKLRTAQLENSVSRIYSILTFLKWVVTIVISGGLLTFFMHH